MTAAPAIQTDGIRPRFSGHESFPLRFGWLAKGVRFCRQRPSGFSADADAMVDLGVGKNMVRSIRFWALEAGMIEAGPAGRSSRTPSLQPTSLGELFFEEEGEDPYMEDPATTWLVHWQLASRPHGPTTWYWLFNLLRSPEFTKDDVLREIRQLQVRNGWAALSDETLARDLDCCLRCYLPSDSDRKLSGEDSLDCPLAELDLLRRGSEPDRYTLARATRPGLSTRVFGYALLEYCRRGLPSNTRAVAFDQVAYAPGSPGQVFRLSENALADELMSLERDTRGAITFGSTAGLRQVYLRELPDHPSELLRTSKRRRHAHA